MSDRAGGRRRLRVLLVSQRMDHTGAPVQLATLLPGLREALGAHLTLLHGSDGPLAATSRPYVDRLLREPRALRALRRVARASPRTAARLLDRVWRAGLRCRIGRVDVVYVNSLISSELATPFSPHPLVVHVHELSGLAQSYGETARRLVRLAAAVLVPSVPAKQWVLDCGVEDRDIVVVPGALAPSWFEPPPTSEVAALRTSLGLATDDLVVATIGWVGELKGSDRFLAVAERVAARLEHHPVRFLWVGAGADTGEEQRFFAAIRESDLAQVVTVLPGREDLRTLYALADVVLVTSREESLSLVALEGAALGRPVVCFPGAGGPDALADEGVVTLSPTTDAHDVADLVQRLLVDPPQREAAGSTARAAAMAGHGAEASQRLLVAALTTAAGRPAER